MVVLLLTVVGCQSPRSAAQNSTMPNHGPSAPDPRTEALIIQMENQYIADKNSQPTRQHEVEARKKKEAEQKAAKAAAEQKAANEQTAQEAATEAPAKEDPAIKADRVPVPAPEK